MKNPVVIAVLNFVCVAAVFAFLDLCVVRFDTGAFVQAFTKAPHLIFTGVFALITSIGAFFQARKTAAA